MKKLVFLFAFFSLHGAAQVTYDVKFSDGTQRIVTIDYDDPDRLPRFMMPVTVFGFTVMVPEVYYSLAVQPQFRINDNMKVTLPTKIVARSLVGTPVGATKNKSLFFIAPKFQYRIYNINKTSPRKVLVGIAGNNAYSIKAPLSVGRSIWLDLGINRGATEGNIPLQFDTTGNNFDNVMAKNYRYIGFNPGITYVRSESYMTSLDGVTMSRFKQVKWHLGLTYLLAQNMDVYGYEVTGYSAYGPTSQETAITSGYTPATVNKIGWNLGFESLLGFKNSNQGIIIGFDYGRFPFWTNIMNDSEYTTTEEYFTIHFGFCIGSSLYQKK